MLIILKELENIEITCYAPSYLLAM